MAEIKISVYDSPVQNTTRKKDLPWSEFAKIIIADPQFLPDNSSESKTTGSYFVRGLTNGKRDDDSLLECNLIPLDIDSQVDNLPLPSPTEIHESLADVVHAVHNTATPSRCRIIFPVAPYPKEKTAEVTEAAYRLCRERGLNFALSNESKTKSQPFFLPQTTAFCDHQAFAKITGERLDYEAYFNSRTGDGATKQEKTESTTNHLEEFIKELKADTIHEAAKTYAGWLHRTTNLTSRQIFKDISVLVDSFCTDTQKVKRWHKNEREGFEKWFKANVESKENPENNHKLKDRIKELCHLDQIDSELAIKKIAKDHKISQTVIRKQLKDYQVEELPSASIVQDVEAHHTEVDGKELLAELINQLERYVILPESAAQPIALWILLTYCFQSFRILPCLAVVSPEKRCGKTTLLEVIQGAANKALMASNISSAAVYRVVEKESPTLLIDEADTYLPGNDELRGIINSGHTRASAFVIRVNPETLEPERFNTFTPKVLALIGMHRLPETIQDRSVIVQLRRKLSGERTEKLDIDFEENCQQQREMCKRWAEDHLEVLRATRPDIPLVSNDRAADNWMPLLSIAETISSDCYDLAKSNMLSLLNESTADDSNGTKLLTDIQSIFNRKNISQISSNNLVDDLISLKESPWGEYGRNGKPITQRNLATILKGFGIRSKNIKTDGRVLKSYTLKSFKDAFERYLHPTPPILSATPLLSNNINKIAHKLSATETNQVADKKQLNILNLQQSSGVADRTPPGGSSNKKEHKVIL